jgi:methylenetetrahydrofolate dehydrogenase (NADP+)/methenyltetrahydrofolate cyclohydrolase
MAIILDGKSIAEKIYNRLEEDLATYTDRPSLLIISFDTKQNSFVERKKAAALRLGIKITHKIIEQSQPKKGVEKELHDLCHNKSYDSIIIQLPVPSNFSNRIVNFIPFVRDPDCLCDRSVGRFFNGVSTILPPTAAAVMLALRQHGDINKKNVVIFGHGLLVGRFLVKMLLDAGAKVKIVAHHLDTGEQESLVHDADVVISATGSPHVLDSRIIPDGAAVIDVGSSIVDEKVVGDIKFDSHARFSLISPVPGGIGPIGVAVLFENIVTLWKKKKKL